MSGLFNLGQFVLHSGGHSGFKIDCDALTTGDWEAIAFIVSKSSVWPWSSVEGVPRGGIEFAMALSKYNDSGPLLIAEDVLTTGASMEKQRAGREAKGVVLFDRGRCPDWVTPIFVMTMEAQDAATH